MLIEAKPYQNIDIIEAYHWASVSRPFTLVFKWTELSTPSFEKLVHGVQLMHKLICVEIPDPTYGQYMVYLSTEVFDMHIHIGTRHE